VFVIFRRLYHTGRQTPGNKENHKEYNMSLFGFAKDIGRRLFNKDEEAAEKIKAHIEAHNPGVTDLQVVFDDGIVNMGGTCDSVDAFQKVVLMAGNIKGVVDVYTSKLRVKASAGSAETAVATAAEGGAEQQQFVPEGGPEVQYYIIKSGDTLSKIAKNFYGKASDYPRIFEANREVIEDPDLIFPGQKIRIPS
jgi:nucleoid-associated protein YgaU